MKTGILSLIGNTPMIKLDNIYPNRHFEFYVKLESFNPGGSAKDRAALHMIKKGLEEGVINSNTVIIESSSGNLAIALAQVCKYYHLKLICVIDKKTVRQNIEMIRAYGAEIKIVTEPDPITGEYLSNRIRCVKELHASIKNSFWPNQYANHYNKEAHYRTMSEICEALDNQVDYLFCAASTCGTIMGCAEYIRNNKLHTKVIAVDALGSKIFSDYQCTRLIPGHGASQSAELLDKNLIDEYILINDLECIEGCLSMMEHEAIMIGGSGGAVISAVGKKINLLQCHTKCVAILHDHGSRYIDTVFSDEWAHDYLNIEKLINI